MKAHRSTSILASFVLLASIGNAVRADDPPDWYAAATGCTPYHDAIAQDLYSNANGRVRFKPGKMGTIWLVCNLPGRIKPIGTANPNDRYLSITYQMPKGGRVTHVAASAVLKAVSKNKRPDFQFAARRIECRKFTYVARLGYPDTF